MNKRQMLMKLGIEDSCDTAKPQPWVDAMADYGFDRRDLFNSYVWRYRKDDCFGKPFNVRGEFMLWVEQNAVVVENELYEELYQFLDRFTDCEILPDGTKRPNQALQLLSKLTGAKSETMNF